MVVAGWLTKMRSEDGLEEGMPSFGRCCETQVRKSKRDATMTRMKVGRGKKIAEGS